MKIYCEKCGEDITDVISHNLEQNKIGNYICKKCGNKQKRYISETDLLVYLTFQEAIYFLLSFITSLLFNIYKLSIVIIIFLLAMFIVAIICTTYFKTYLYINAPLKKATMFKARNEDQNKIAKSIRWQFLMFFALVITFFTTNTAYWFFVFASLAIVVVTLIKAILSAKNE